MSKKRTPTEAVKFFCKVFCCCGVQSMVKNCKGKVLFSEKSCPFHFYRLGKGRISVKIIRQHCLNFCMGGSKKAVKGCPSKDCPLYPFRLGTNPNYKKKGRDQRSKIAVKKNLSKIGLESRLVAISSKQYKRV